MKLKIKNIINLLLVVWMILSVISVIIIIIKFITFKKILACMILFFILGGILLLLIDWLSDFALVHNFIDTIKSIFIKDSEFNTNKDNITDKEED